jgi:WD40 repeat protein/tetratricopeptide (TPR) repeat protein
VPRDWRLFGRKSPGPARNPDESTVTGAPPANAVAPPTEALAQTAEAAALLARTRAWLDLPPHPHLRAAYYLHLEDGHPQVVAEEVPGEDLATAARAGRLGTPGEVLDAAVQLAWGLQAVHDAGLSHGDVRTTTAVLAEDGVVQLAGSGELASTKDDGDLRALATVVTELFDGPERPPMPETVAALLRDCPPTAREFADRLIAVYPEATGSPYPREVPQPVEPLANEWNNRAVSLALAGEHAEAEQYWERALRDDPRHPDATFNLGLSLWRTARITDDELLRRLEAAGQTSARQPDSRVVRLAGLVDGERGRPWSDEDADPPLTARCKAGWLYAVAVTPDGRHAVWGAEDGVVLWWNFDGGEVVKLTGHTEAVWAVAVTPDGRFALSGAADNTLRYWDLTTRRCLRVLKGHRQRVRGVAISPDGRFAVSCAEDGRVLRWDLDSGKETGTITEEKVGLISIAMTPDTQYVAVAGNHGSLQWREVRTGRLLHTLTGHSDDVYAVAVTPDGRYALSSDGEGEVRWWNLRTGECLRTITGHVATAAAVAISADGRQGVSGSMDRTVRRWDLATGRCLRTIEHDYLVLGVGMSADGGRVVSTATDRKLRVWDQAAAVTAPWSYSPTGSARELGSRAREFRSEVSQIRYLLANAAVPAATERLLKITDLPGYARHPEVLELWREAGRSRPRTAFMDLRRVHTIENPAGLTALALAPDGRRALAAGWDYTLRLWDLETGECLKELTGHQEAVTSIAFAPDGSTAVSASAEHTLRVWDLSTGACPRVLSGHSDEVTAVAVAASGHVLSASADHTLRWWDPRTGECHRVLSGHTGAVSSVALTPDGRHAVSGGADATVQWWDLGTGECLETLRSHKCGSRAVGVTPDGRLVVSGEDCGNLSRWELPEGRGIESLTGHQGPMLGLAVTADGEHVLTVGADRDLRVRELRSGRNLRVVTEHDDEVFAVAVAPDGWSAVTGGRDGTVIGWALDWNHEPGE